MPIIFGILWYEIQALWVRIFPSKEFTTEIESIQENNEGRYAVVAVREKKTKKLISKTRVFLLADDFVKKVQQHKDGGSTNGLSGS